MVEKVYGFTPPPLVGKIVSDKSDPASSNDQQIFRKGGTHTLAVSHQEELDKTAPAIAPVLSNAFTATTAMSRASTSHRLQPTRLYPGPKSGDDEGYALVVRTDVGEGALFQKGEEKKMSSGGSDVPIEYDDAEIYSANTARKETTDQDMEFAHLLNLIRNPEPSRATAQAIIAAASLKVSDENANSLKIETTALLNCNHEWSQVAAAKFLADSIQTGESWQQIVVAALTAAKNIPESAKSTSRAKSMRNLLNRAISACPSLTAPSVLRMCAGAQVPPHISNLVGTWATKYTSTSEAPVWHEILASLSLPDKFQITEHSETCATLKLGKKDNKGDPCIQLLWNVNGFSSRWKSGDLSPSSFNSSPDSAKQRVKKRRYTRKLAKDDFKAVVRKAGYPDLISVIEAKMSLRKMVSLPGFTTWCEDKGYIYISLSCSSSTTKGGAGYAGIMTLSKFKPLSTKFDLANTPKDEARIITHEFPSFVHISIYSPCTGYDEVKMKSRVNFDSALSDHIALQRRKFGKPMICSGDLNVNPRRQDWHEKAFESLARLRHNCGNEYHPGNSPSGFSS